MPTFKPFDVKVVPFPLTDSATAKRRSSLVISAIGFTDRAAHAVLAMITCRKKCGWPLDTEIHEPAAAGLSHPSVVRVRIFTLDERFILRKAGALTPADPRRAAKAPDTATRRLSLKSGRPRAASRPDRRGASP